ncbi:hypothetical protein [Parapedobacter lycopersici]|uniref:hypothetical protein n=1 Tax=Parapedobacter lycopersici TaxID=1864939 RepID=UPI00214DDD2E|nr:hypothetical protein [Parapedobacter lycopersici]
MRQQILSHLDNPRQLEQLYRADKPAFTRTFNTLYSEIKDSTLATYWNERLNFTTGERPAGNRNELIFIGIASLLAGLIAKLPALFGIDETFFYSRNVGFVVFPLLTAYFAWQHKLPSGRIAVLAGATLLGLVFINFLPNNEKSDTLVLSCIHLPLWLWAILGAAFTGNDNRSNGKRIGFLTYNGDLLVMTGLLLIAGIALSGITLGLFSLIGLAIETLYFRNIGMVGLAAAPIVGTYLVRSNPQLVGKIAPVIARIFCPLVLVMLVTYLAATLYAGKDPYRDREFLLVFNILLIGVMALIFFAIAGTSTAAKSRAELWLLLLLSALTIAVNGIALSAVLFRISTWGITPNRVAVLGGNVLILINLLLVTIQLFRVLKGTSSISGVENIVAVYLPVYALWAAVVTFLFPLLFGFQ